MMLIAGLSVNLLISAISGLPDVDTDFADDRVVLSGTHSERRAEDSPGRGVSSDRSSGSSASSSSSVPDPVWRCDRVDTVMMQGRQYSQCMYLNEPSDTPLSSMVDLAFDTDDAPVDTADAEIPDPIVVTASDLQSLPIITGGINVQPPGGRALINAEVLAHSTAGQHILTTTIMGTTVDVRLTPVRWTWQFSGQDHESFTTDHPGGPYPDMSVQAIYSRVGEDRAVTSTITWMGEYRIASGPWLLVQGNATTTAVSAPFDTIEAPARLVTDTLDG